MNITILNLFHTRETSDERLTTIIAQRLLGNYAKRTHFQESRNESNPLPNKQLQQFTPFRVPKKRTHFSATQNDTKRSGEPDAVSEPIFKNPEMTLNHYPTTNYGNLHDMQYNKNEPNFPDVLPESVLT